MKPFHQAACQTQNFKSHFVSNIIFIQWEWWGQESWGEGGGGLSTRRGCYFKDKRIHQSKLEGNEAPGFGWCSGVCVGLTDKVTAGLLGGRADVRDPCLKFPIFWHLQPTAPERLLRRLIKRPSEWDCLTAATINNHSQHPDQEMCRQSSPLNN